MLDTSRIAERLSLIRGNSRILERDYKDQPKDRFFKDEMFNASAERLLQTAIQACIDISNHIIASLGLKKPKEDTAETFRILYKEGILPEDFAKTMVSITGYRNVLVHGYLDVDKEETYKNINFHLDDLAQFAKYIEEFLERYEAKMKR
ncbi:hypothetical protein A2955_02535 [Candidatus Woesebacteria bacterium RIFCSPLOWO2_01_FULL_37_19]|uniref:DUF86 domain-containing protein n=2 Tax=Candidatus Woeseibacteriota TaxID=1752722 RepID=A0A1F8AYE7_9BACT|nr:MAG: hypothetical protein A2771_02660 [Candidatus Woesebacteria bacterium RIFCSPHIGHO2_01_FULL_38_26b]OGM56784.1 MAG: hypothetical protein A2955_02535 [Candidatus Woesebacteria bacterium RIFCSPLOWO2_01_FULL_37_19]